MTVSLPASAATGASHCHHSTHSVLNNQEQAPSSNCLHPTRNMQERPSQVSQCLEPGFVCRYYRELALITIVIKVVNF